MTDRLSRQAQHFADEINMRDWRSAPYDPTGTVGPMRARPDDADRADLLTTEQARRVRESAAAMVAQVLGWYDPNFDPVTFFNAVGVHSDMPPRLRTSLATGALRYVNGDLQEPGVVG